MRLLLPALCAATALWLLPVWHAPRSVAEPPARPARPGHSAAGCDPAAPILVGLDTLDGAGPGVVRVLARVEPLVELEALTWHWELSADVARMQGEAAGSGSPGRGAVTEGELVVLVPADGRHHRVELVVSGRLPASAGRAPVAAADDGADDGEPEWVTTVVELTWGEPGPPAPVVLSTDAETGAPVPVLAVPARHAPAAARDGR